MKPSRLFLAAGLVLLSAYDLLAVRRTEDPLALVPADAATVAVMHWNQLRQTPLAARVFRDFDRISGDDDAARFLEETGLTPREDIDTILLAMSPRTGSRESGLVLFEGRFDLARISKALVSREATLRTSPSGDYYVLRERGGEPGAVALVNRGLIVCGHEEAVTAALARRESGGDGGLTSGQGIGRYLSRVDRDASAWALVDVAHFPAAERREDAGPGDPSQAVFSAMKSVSFVALQATVKSDGLEIEATGLTTDAENRDLLADALRGVLAMWRLAVQEKAPEMVSILRRFQIDSDSDGVSIRGTLPSSFLESLGHRRQATR
jgi:hypothetical protein